MNDRIEAEMMERDHTRSLARTFSTAAVAIVGIVASCCVWFPWDPPEPSEKTETEQCTAMCTASQRAVTRFVKSGRYWNSESRTSVDTPMVCECAGQVISP